ncbi:MAG: hypothetical protein L0215_17845 [Gemmataceae bacterium]|nr:hypothetical protein [Gemmataceae bacterium]
MRHWLAACVAAVFVTDAQAQILWSPSGFPGGHVHQGNGIGFHYQRRHLTVNGFITSGYCNSFVPVYPVLVAPIYPAPRVVVHVVPAPFIIGPRVLGPGPDVDLSGVDLDVVGPEALWPNGKFEPPKFPKFQPPPPVEPPAPPKKMPKLQAEELPKKPEQPAIPEPKKVWFSESDRLIDLGMTAFKNKEYGLAAMRFRQAAEADPKEAKPHFFLAQSYLAMGKFRDAVAAIEAGLKRLDSWPLAQFQPRLDMYQGLEDEWLDHKRQLEEVHARHLEQPAYAFLLAYVLWFDNERDEAAMLFRKTRPLMKDPSFIDLFLKVAQEVAAK